MKNRNTSWQDQDKLELLVSLGNAHVTKVTNGIAFSGKVPLSFEEQAALNARYEEAATERSKQSRIQAFIHDKAAIMCRVSCSKDIAEELISAAKQYYWKCESRTFAVKEVPCDIEYEIELLLSVLSDLADYTETKRSEEEVSENLEYLSEFWKEDVSECEKKDLEDAEAEA